MKTIFNLVSIFAIGGSIGALVGGNFQLATYCLVVALYFEFKSSKQ